jgi:hypothetical protein
LGRDPTNGNVLDSMSKIAQGHSYRGVEHEKYRPRVN